MTAPHADKILVPVPRSGTRRPIDPSAGSPTKGPRETLAWSRPNTNAGVTKRPGVQVLAVRSGAAKVEAAGVLRNRLEPFQVVRVALLERGVPVDPESGEGAEAYLNRMGTSLMALYRDGADYPAGTGAEAFNALYALTRDSILAWVRSLLSRNTPALDPNELLQDTFVNVYRYPRSFRDEHVGSFRVWVRTIAGNLVRRAGTRRARYSFHALPEGLQEPADTSSNPAVLAAAVDESRLLVESWKLFLLLYAQAWEELSERDRQTLQLVEVDGLSYEDAGRILGVGRSNMKMIVFRSRNRIARRIARFMAAGRLSALGLEVA